MQRKVTEQVEMRILLLGHAMFSANCIIDQVRRRDRVDIARTTVYKVLHRNKIWLRQERDGDTTRSRKLVLVTQGATRTRGRKAG